LLKSLIAVLRLPGALGECQCCWACHQHYRQQTCFHDHLHVCDECVQLSEGSTLGH